jgi:sulfatase modifying factor 1
MARLRGSQAASFGAVSLGIGAVLVGCGAILGLEDDGIAPVASVREAAAPSAPPASVPDSGDDAGLPPSCAGAAAVCPNASSCCAATLVPGGSFYRSWDGVPDGGWEDRSYPATVLPFYLDRFEVVVGRFRMFVAAGMGNRDNPPKLGSGTAPGLPSTGWTPQYTAALEKDSAALRQKLATSTTPALSAACTYDDADPARDQTPIGCVTWYEAFAFCIWDGGRLPTEAEWNYAASAGSEQRAYPWSNPAEARTLTAGHATFGLDGGKPKAAGSHSPLGDGRFGQTDLAGNVAEWIFDPFAAYPSPCVGSCVATSGRGRQVRGGAYEDPPAKLLTSARGVYLDPPTLRLPTIGLRCARDRP